MNTKESTMMLIKDDRSVGVMIAVYSIVGFVIELFSECACGWLGC